MKLFLNNLLDKLYDSGTISYQTYQELKNDLKTIIKEPVRECMGTVAFREDYGEM